MKAIQTDKDKNLNEEAKTLTTKTTNPSCTLFVENITPDITEKLLNKVFEKYNGLRKLRLMNNQYAIVEFESEEQSLEALKGTNNLKLTDQCKLRVSFGKN